MAGGFKRSGGGNIIDRKDAEEAVYGFLPNSLSWAYNKAAEALEPAWEEQKNLTRHNWNTKIMPVIEGGASILYELVMPDGTSESIALENAVLADKSDAMYAIQEMLNATGNNVGTEDGVKGPDTIAGINGSLIASGNDPLQIPEGGNITMAHLQQIALNTQRYDAANGTDIYSQFESRVETALNDPAANLVQPERHSSLTLDIPTHG